MQFIFAAIFIAALVAYFIARAFSGTGKQITERLDQIEQNTHREQTPQKRCPECAESVNLAASTCRYCGHQFDPTTVSFGTTVTLQAGGPNTLALMVPIKMELKLSNRAAKDLIDSAPVVLLKETTPENALRLKALLEAEGATVEIS